MFSSLEDKAPAGGMAHFVQVGVAGKLDHGWRTTHEDECVFIGGRKAVKHHMLTDEALAVLPACHVNIKNTIVCSFNQSNNICNNVIISIRTDHSNRFT